MENSRRQGQGCNQLVNSESRRKYKIAPDDPIGTDSDGSPVYRVAYFVKPETYYPEGAVVSPKVLSMKVIPRSSAAQFANTLSRNLNLPGVHKNLTPIKEPPFLDMDTGDLCIPMPFFDLGSLRSAMAAKFPHGLPEACISVSLRCVLKALSFLHDAGVLHRNVSAGHIYVKRGPEIMLGFSATLYELQGAAECSSSSSSSSSSLLPVTGISNWAAAPEVYDCDYISTDTKSGRYRYSCSKKSDIWLVGITALELAYGEISVPNREALEAIIQKITKTKRLPTKLRSAAMEPTDRKRKATMEEDQEEEGSLSSFSREFGELVAQCLAWDPKERPSADALLDHKFFWRKESKRRRELKSHFLQVLSGDLSLLEYDHPVPPLYLSDESLGGRGVVYQVIRQIGLSLPGHLPICRVAYSHDPSRSTRKDCAVIIMPYRYPLPANPIDDDILHPHESFVELLDEFEQSDSDRDKYFIFMGYPQYRSLRTVMAEHFPEGLPESSIIYVMRTVLEGLTYLHSTERIHGQINAGHLYVDGGGKVRLGYDATVYEHGVIESPEWSSTSGSLLPEIGISEWAAAPEVYDDPNHHKTREGDVWLVGILALELAYGGVRVPNREALEDIIRSINRTRCLPRTITPEDGGGAEKTWLFPQFDKLVADCLTWDPRQRPTAASLLTHLFFTVWGNTSFELLFDSLVMERLRE